MFTPHRSIVNAVPAVPLCGRHCGSSPVTRSATSEKYLRGTSTHFPSSILGAKVAETNTENKAGECASCQALPTC